MTNEQIIHNAKMLRGITEDAHTFARWKSMGYAVRKGEKAAFKAAIWKHSVRKVTDEDGEEKEAASMFMKTAHFFTASQVEPMKVRG